MAGYGYNNIDTVNFLLVPDTLRPMIELSNKRKLKREMNDTLFVLMTEKKIVSVSG